MLYKSPADLKAATAFLFSIVSEAMGPDGVGGRVELYEKPANDWLCVVGADTAYGIQGRDYDAACILCVHPAPLRQVGEIHGHYGDRFDRLLYAACRYFNDAFLLIERQTLGLAILQRLYHDYDYRYLYYERKQHEKGRRITDVLGHPKSDNDLLLWNFRNSIIDGRPILRSRALLAQMSKLQFRESTPSPDAERARDEDLKVHLAGGGSPDLVMSAAYATFAASQVVHFEKPKPAFEPGSLGDILGHGTTFDDPDEGKNTWVKRRKR